MYQNIFFFLFGFPEGHEGNPVNQIVPENANNNQQATNTKDIKKEEAKNAPIEETKDSPPKPSSPSGSIEEEHQLEELDDMLDFLNTDQFLIHNTDNKDLFELGDGFEIPKEDPLLEEEPIVNNDMDIPMIRIGNHVMPGLKDHNPQPTPEPRGRNKERTHNATSKRGARSVSVLALKDPKLELDILSSILDGVEQAEKEVEQNFERQEQEDYQVEIKVKDHLVVELSKAIIMGILSDQQHMSAV